MVDLGSRSSRSLLTVCVAVFAAYMGAGMISTVRVLYVQHRGGSLAVISAMATAFFVTNFALQYPWGWLADRWGRRRVILAGMLIQAAVSLGYVLVSDPVWFVILRAVEGAGAASILPAARAAIADLVPDESRGKAYGMFSAFFNLGFLFGPAAGGLLGSLDYTTVFLFALGLRLAGAAVVWTGLKTPARAAAPADQDAEGRPGPSLFNLGLMAAYVIAFGDYLWLGFDQTLAPLWMRHHLGASLALIGIAYSAWALPGTIFAPIGGRLADRYPRWRLVLLAGLGQLPMYGLYIASHSIYPVMAGFVLQACLYAIVSPAVDAHLARAAPSRSRGRAQSVFTAAGLMGAFVGATAFAPLYAVNYRLPLAVQGVGYGAVILAGSLMIRTWERRRRLALANEGVMDEAEGVTVPAG